MLLIDEIDRADEEFEAFLLEVLSEFQVTIPEVGTIRATAPPYVILTSNRVRELSDALRRRCLYLWIDFPGFEKELRIVTRKVPGVNERLAHEISGFMETVRTLRLAKVPGVAETLDSGARAVFPARRLSGRGARRRDARLRSQGRRRRKARQARAGHWRTRAFRRRPGLRRRGVPPGPHPRRPALRRAPARLQAAGDDRRADGRGARARGGRSARARRGLPRAAHGAREPHGGAAGLRPLLRRLLAGGHRYAAGPRGGRAETAPDRRRKENAPEGAAAAPPPAPADFALEEWDDEAGEGEPLELPGMSAHEVLVEQDFATFSAEQLDEVAQLTAQIAKRLARRVSRRRKPTRRKGAVDLRRSFRANLMRGEIVELRRRTRRRRKLKLVLLCDVSGSMDLYSRFLLQFLYALQNVFGRVETFTFATRLTRVTELLRADPRIARRSRGCAT
ncbi:MAG: VWA domain-containing protein [Burkholderiales bacterium]|nr:VWA domain-containing protein [Burkholderiales bacterium]